MKAPNPRARILLTFLAGVLCAALAMSLSVQLSQASNRYEDLSVFSSVIAHVRRHYVEPVDEHELITSAIRGMMSELDPHSAFMDPDQYREMQVDTKGEFHGLGIEIVKAPDSFVEVVSPIEGTPAARAGIRARDQIVKICPTEVPEDWEPGERCRSTEKMTLFDAVKLMRGRKGTEITVYIFREGFEEPRPFKIVRDVVLTPSVTSRVLEDGYGYVKVSAFQERTADDLEEALDDLTTKAGGALQGLVIDLRNNPGGLLDQAVRVADLWLDDGLVVYTQGREESQRLEFPAKPGRTQPRYPIVVIVNEGSASASEIVAGALQDHRRALVVGRPTFGKGSVQTVFPIGDDYGLRLTTALYYTPRGRSIQEVGIKPDIVIEEEPQLADAKSPRHIREADLEGHIRHEDAEPGAAPAPEPVASLEPAPADGGEDRVVARALEVLKSWAYFRSLESEPEAAPLSARAEAAAGAPAAATR